MTTAEPVIASALLQSKEYDVLKCVKRNTGFLSSTDIHEPYRIQLLRMEGLGSIPTELHPHSKSPIPLDPDESPLAEDLVVDVCLHGYNEPLVPQLRSQHSIRATWNEWIFFPILISELPLDTVITLTVYHVDGIVGGTSFHPFTSRGELKSGSRRYGVSLGQEADGTEDSTTLGHVPSMDWDKLARDFQQGRMATAPWLDELVASRIDRLNDERQHQLDKPTLVLELPSPNNGVPIFHLSVPSTYDSNAAYYASKPSPFVPYHDMDFFLGLENLSEGKSAVLSKSLHLVADKDAQPSFSQRKQINAILSRPPIRVEPYKVDDAALLWQFRYFLVRDTKGFVPFMSCVDWTIPAETHEAESLIPQWKMIPGEEALILLSNLYSKVVSLRRYAISTLSRQSPEQLNLLLLQLVQGVRYDVEHELANFLQSKALENWELCSNLYWYVSVEADLESKHGASVKNWAKIQEAGSEVYKTLKQELLDQLLRENPTFRKRLQEQEHLRSVLLNIYTSLTKEASKDRGKRIELLKKTIDEGKCGIGELFTKGKRMRSSSVHRPSYIEGTTTSEGGDGNTPEGSITASTTEGATSSAKKQEMGEDPLNAMAGDHNIVTKTGEVYLPGYPNVAVCGMRSKGVYLFKSAKQPVKIPFVLADSSENDELLATRSEVHTDEQVAPLGTEPSVSVLDETTTKNFPSAQETIDIMFKCGDDVRQDQLVIQIIQLMDTLLKQNGLNLCLTPYRVLATSQMDGFMEIVPGVATFQDVQKETVVKYIQRHNPVQKDFDKAIDRFVKSCAGYSVITFLLGIGDRHLENLLLTTDGRLLHIDFGFILGNDPKPFPPPMKLNKEMVDAMGGLKSKQFSDFQRLCCSAYNILRKHANLILNLLVLMIDASIPNIADGKVNPKLNIMKVQDKLRLDLNDAEAMQYLLGVISASIGSVFTNLWDVVHEAAQAVRN